ncbi:MAG: hypothetical protein WDM70_08015 [Nitrosomonadales bacterium]
MSVPPVLLQQIVYGQELPPQWWSLFHSEALDQLIRSALQQNPTLAAAQSALRQAQENFKAESGAPGLPERQRSARSNSGKSAS